MRINLCSGGASNQHGSNGHLATILEPHLRAAGADVVRLDQFPQTPAPDADWWLMLCYQSHLTTWLQCHKRFGGRSRAAYTQSAQGGPGVVNLPWAPVKGVPTLAPFTFIEEAYRRRHVGQHDGVIVDSGWPGYQERGLDLTDAVVSALNAYEKPKVALLAPAVPSNALETQGWRRCRRMPRREFLALLGGADALVMTHRESYGAIVPEALFLGVRVLAHPPYLSRMMCGWPGVTTYNDPAEIPGILADQPSNEQRLQWSREIGSVETAAREMVERLGRVGRA